ncbi:hypothetical protein Baya_6673 [Bagarius yarrelli]|uniref:Uncharacterized protein n=1 Tax=Bagarius yarrelli TaxID=175774 RepID=A0A556U1J7_BAGYA|nr:hypothetical protein Baya_6673 [Bagarius yarrelli]
MNYQSSVPVSGISPLTAVTAGHARSGCGPSSSPGARTATHGVPVRFRIIRQLRSGRVFHYTGDLATIRQMTQSLWSSGKTCRIGIWISVLELFVRIGRTAEQQMANDMRRGFGELGAKHAWSLGSSWHPQRPTH